jgi:hypothetical protein
MSKPKRNPKEMIRSDVHRRCLRFDISPPMMQNRNKALPQVWCVLVCRLKYEPGKSKDGQITSDHAAL